MLNRKRMSMIGCGRFILALLIMLIVIIGISVLLCSCVIKVTQYAVPVEGLQNTARIVVAADLHGKVYANDNQNLYQKITKQRPDAIFLLGDLFPANPKEEDLEYVFELTREMQSISQVYFALGNHETDYTAKYGSAWLKCISETGAIVLAETWGDYVIAGNTIRLGCTMGHGFLFGRTVTEYEASPEFAVLSALEDSPYPTVLLAHMPDTIAFEDAKMNWHIDLVLSGHTHGGVIRIPGKGGLYAPMQGWWPPYDYGLFVLNEQMRMIITSGLSGHAGVPRLFNLPEIVAIDLKPE